MNSFKFFQESGLLWAINAQVFHPRGLAIAFSYDEDGEVDGWLMLGDGSEVWSFESETNDSGFERFNNYIKGVMSPS